MRRMSIYTALLVPLFLQSAVAQEKVGLDTIQSDEAIARWTGFAQHRAESHFGHGGISSGAEHYELPSHHYTTWYRPKAHESGKADRCRPADWRPRGFGNLFYRRQGYRMDYAAYRLADPRTPYGPAYYPTGADENCDCHEGKECKSCCKSGSCNTCNNGCQKKSCIEFKEVNRSKPACQVHHLGTLHR